MSDNKKSKKFKKIGLYPTRSANRHLRAEQFGTAMAPTHKVINHLDWDPTSGRVRHVVEYVTSWQ
jgi:hypothetical protein